MVGTVTGDGAPRSLSDIRSPFFNFLGLAVLADASTAFAIVSLRLFSFEHNWDYSPTVGSLANSQHSCRIIVTSPLHATPVDRSLVMRALGGAITSPCSNDSEGRRPTPAIFGLYPFLLRFCWLVVYLNKLPKRHSLGDCYLYSVFIDGVYSCHFNTENRCLDCYIVSADRRATARTTTFIEPCSY